MRDYVITTLILCAFLGIGAYYLKDKKGDVHVKEFTYNPEDWVTTSYTQIAIDFSNDRDDTFKWQQLPQGLQLKPIVRYNRYTVVDLPDGRRGLVAPSTLTGTMRDGEFKAQRFTGYSMSMKDIRTSAKVKKEPTDSTFSLIGFLTAKQDYDINRNASRSTIKPKDYGLSCVVIQVENTYYSIKAKDLLPNFAADIPMYYTQYEDEFKIYVSANKLSKMSQEEIDNTYGEPLSISPLSATGGKRAFYKHLRTKESYNYLGLFINYNEDGTTTVEDPRNNNKKNSPSYIESESRPFLSRITDIDWVDLPLAFPIISAFHLNFTDISTSQEESFPYLWVFFGTFVLSILFLITLGYFMISVLFPIKSLSNEVIEFLSFVIPIAPVFIIGTLYMELFQGLWLVCAAITPFMVFIPSVIISEKTEFDRCDLCRTVGCVSYTKTLIDTKVSTRVDTRNYDDTSVDYSWSGDKKTETVIHKRKHTLVETTDKKFRYDFHCSNCHKNWQSVKGESNDRILGSKTVSLGGYRTITTRG